MRLDELKATLDSFSPVKIEFVARVMESLANPPSANIRSRGTWLTSEPDWIEYFGLALSVHHGASTEPLGLSSFETVFRNACEHLRWSIDPPGSRTQRFVDLAVRPRTGNRRRLSLKSTAAKNLSKTALHISKLTEAAWIQDARTARDRRDRTLELFRQYQRAVTQIVMLRAFREDTGKIPHKYQLVEIPVTIFRLHSAGAAQGLRTGCASDRMHRWRSCGGNSSHRPIRCKDYSPASSAFSVHCSCGVG